jgi:ATP-binding cassette subfamily B protein
VVLSAIPTGWLVLDEATSALDAVLEALIKEALQVPLRDRTTLIATHRLSTIRAADRIAYIDAGRIVELDNHDELTALGGRYTALVTQQNT